MTSSITATIHELPVKSRLICSECSAPGEGSCGCGAPYLPAGQRAAEAVAANPEKSDRAIAKDIGVDHKTVAKARKSGGEYSPPASSDAPDKREGQDGKSYPAKVERKKVKPKAERDIEQFNNNISFLHNTFETVVDMMPIPNTIPAEVGKDAIKQLTAVKAFVNELIERIRVVALNGELTPTDEVTP